MLIVVFQIVHAETAKGRWNQDQCMQNRGAIGGEWARERECQCLEGWRAGGRGRTPCVASP